MTGDASEGGGPYRTAHTMGYDDVIDPRDLRTALLAALPPPPDRSGS